MYLHIKDISRRYNNYPFFLREYRNDPQGGCCIQKSWTIKCSIAEYIVLNVFGYHKPLRSIFLLVGTNENHDFTNVWFKTSCQRLLLECTDPPHFNAKV